MSLSLELCKQLKVAGFPQEDRLDPEGCSTIDINEIEEVGSGKYTPSYAQPNSDELLAQIQAEWPMQRIIADITTWGEDKVITYDSWDATECGPGPSGASLAEALANLYIALRE